MNYYQFVPGRDDFPYFLYDKAVAMAEEGDILCEVNHALWGRTTCYMLEQFERAKKGLKFYVFDLFNQIPHPIDGEPVSGRTPWDEEVDQWLGRIAPTTFLDNFDFYIQNCPAASYLTGRAQFTSWQAACEFQDSSVFFCFLKMSVDYQHTKNDIKNWTPKIRKGGSLILYGANQPESVRAVKDVFKIHPGVDIINQNFFTIKV